jgi:hypothetical protein
MGNIDYPRKELSEQLEGMRTRMDYAFAVINSPKPEIKETERDVLLRTYQYLSSLQFSILKYLMVKSDEKTNASIAKQYNNRRRH